MNSLSTGVFVLFALVVPVSSKEIFFTHPVICYFLDAILVVYCIVATALFFKEKFSHAPSAAGPADEGVYQELNREKDEDPYQELQPLKAKKNGKKKKKSETTAAEVPDRDPYETLASNSSAPPPQSPP